MCEAEGYGREITPPICECEFTQSICLKLLLLELEVFSAHCPEFRNSMENGKLETASRPCLKQLEKQISQSFFSPLLQWNICSKELCLP